MALEQFGAAALAHNRQLDDARALKPRRALERVLRALAVILAAAAVVCMVISIAGMVTHRQSVRTGFLLRACAVVCFSAAVAVNVAAH